MQVTEQPVPRSATAEVRRRQIVAATIDVIAEVGYRGASFARIARQAQLSSTRLISYHFAGKDELIGAVTVEVMGDIGHYVGRRVQAENTATGQLRAYLEATVDYIATHRVRMTALIQILLSGALPMDAVNDERVIGHVEAILLQGQRDGEFRDFDARVMATTAQRAVEGLPFLLESTPDLDCAAYARELVMLFDLGTRRAAS